MTDFAQVMGRHVGRGRPRRGSGTRLLALGLIGGGLILAAAPMAYMLWPGPAPVALDAPSIPISVGGVTFNVPPAAVRVAVQRRPGAQPRIDLVFLWPSLTPPDPAKKPAHGAAANLSERIFLTINASDSALPPAERLKTIYPRYTFGNSTVRPDGLTARAFRAGTPYQGEELIFDAGAPERFLLRCTHAVGGTPGMCLHERRIATADVTVRFPRDWLSDWRPVADGIDRLLSALRPS
jgi:hypothetical protein